MTRVFFVAQAPGGQIAMHDNSETVAHVWIKPSEALDLHKQGELDLMFPTIKTLESLTRFQRVQDLLSYAKSKPQVPLMAPIPSVAKDGSIRHLIPSDYAFAEVAKLDPACEGFAKSDIEPGHPVQLATDLWRLTAPNQGVMTGPGTNTYLLGNAETGIAVLDPGPDLAEHVQAILALASGPIKWILCTHTHRDHSPAAVMLKALTGAQVIGMADMLDAMTRERPYQKAQSLDDALETLRESAGGLFEAGLVQACLDLFAQDGYRFPEA